MQPTRLLSAHISSRRLPNRTCKFPAFGTRTKYRVFTRNPIALNARTQNALRDGTEENGLPRPSNFIFMSQPHVQPHGDIAINCTISLCNILFENCSALTHVTVCILALSPYFVARLNEGFNYFVASTIAPLAFVWNDRQVGFSSVGESTALSRYTPKSGASLCKYK